MYIIPFSWYNEAQIKELNKNDDVDGIIVQLPIPKHINENDIINAVIKEGYGASILDENYLEDQNKKLRLLLAESNKNLNWYKPSVFGLYKKVPPGQ